MTSGGASGRGVRRGAFTLIELLLASAAAALILIIINSVFVRAIKLRDDATERVRDTRLRARAEHAIRDDLQSALVSGGILASTLVGGTSSTSGPGGASYPGYLQMTTSNGHSTSGIVASDVQQVEYYIEKDPNGSAETKGGVLVRALTRNLLATAPTVDKQEAILGGVESLQVQFYDGATWQDTWEFDSDTASAGVRLGELPVPATGARPSPPATPRCRRRSAWTCARSPRNPATPRRRRWKSSFRGRRSPSSAATPATCDRQPLAAGSRRTHNYNHNHYALARTAKIGSTGGPRQ